MENKNFWEDYVGHTVPEEPEKIIMKNILTGEIYEVTEEEYIQIRKRQEAIRQIIRKASKDFSKKLKERKENEGKRKQQIY